MEKRILILLVLFAFVACNDQKSNEGIEDDELGFINADVTSEETDFKFRAEYMPERPGESEKIERAFENAPPLILDSFVRVEIAGNTLENVFAIDEDLLHNGQQIWLLSEQNTLDIKTITPIYSEQGQVFIDVQQIPDKARIISSTEMMQKFTWSPIKVVTRGIHIRKLF